MNKTTLKFRSGGRGEGNGRGAHHRAGPASPRIHRSCRHAGPAFRQPRHHARPSGDHGAHAAAPGASTPPARMPSGPWRRSKRPHAGFGLECRCRGRRWRRRCRRIPASAPAPSSALRWRTGLCLARRLDVHPTRGGRGAWVAGRARPSASAPSARAASSSTAASKQRGSGRAATHPLAPALPRALAPRCWYMTTRIRGFSGPEEICRDGEPAALRRHAGRPHGAPRA